MNKKAQFKMKAEWQKKPANKSSHIKQKGDYLGVVGEVLLHLLTSTVLCYPISSHSFLSSLKEV